MGKSLVFFALCVLGGIAGGYYGASFMAAPAQIAVVDIQALVKKSSPMSPEQGETDAQALTRRIKATTAKLVEQGIVVLDAQAIVDAPEDAYVSVD